MLLLTITTHSVTCLWDSQYHVDITPCIYLEVDVSLCVFALTFLRGAWNVKIVVEADVDPELAFSHSVLLQVTVDGEGTRPVEPDDRQVAVHWERSDILGSWEERNKVVVGRCGMILVTS